MAVGISLPVGLVVLPGVGHHVGQGETVVGGHQVHRRRRRTPTVVELSGGAEQAGAEVGLSVVVAAPGLAHAVAEGVVPFRPRVGEAPQLVAAGPDVPRFGDQLHTRQHRVLACGLEEGRRGIETAGAAAQRRRQVEAEPVDAQFSDPVTQTVHDQPEYLRTVGGDGVAGPGVVDVVAARADRPAVEQPVVAGIVQPAKAQRGPVLVAFPGVVVDHVDDDLDACLVQGVDHPAELGGGILAALAGGIAGLGGEPGDRLVAPVVHLVVGHQVAVVDEALHRQQLHGSDPQPVQVGDHRGGGQSGVGAPQFLRHIRVCGGETFEVGLVDHQVAGVVVGTVGRRVGVTVPASVSVPVPGPAGFTRCRGDDALRHHRGTVPGVGGAVVVGGFGVTTHQRVPAQRGLDGAGVGVDQELGGVEPQAVVRVVGASGAQAVAGPDADAGGVAVAHAAVGVGQDEPLLGGVCSVRAVPVCALPTAEDAELDLVGIRCPHRDIDPGAGGGDPQRPGTGVGHRHFSHCSSVPNSSA